MVNSLQVASAEVAEGTIFTCSVKEGIPSYISPWGFLEEVALELAFFFPHFSRMTKSFTFIMTNSNKPELHRSSRKFSCSLLSIPSPEGTTVTGVAFILFKVFLSLHVWMWISLSRVRLFVTPWTVAHQVLLSMGFSRQEYWSGLPFPSAGDLLDPRIKLGSPALQAVWATREACTCVRTSLLISGVTVTEPNWGLLAGCTAKPATWGDGKYSIYCRCQEREWEMSLRSTPEVVFEAGFSFFKGKNTETGVNHLLMFLFLNYSFRSQLVSGVQFSGRDLAIC